MDSDDLEVDGSACGAEKRTHGATDTEISGSDTEVELMRAPKPPAARRGKTLCVARGIGIARARAALRKMEENAREEALDREWRSRALRKEPPTLVLDPAEGEIEEGVVTSTLNAEELRALAGRSTAAILEVAKKSGQLQGPLGKQLKESAATLQEVVDTLATRPEADETSRLRKDNGRLRREMEALRVELEDQRREVDALRASMAARVSSSQPLTQMKEDEVEELRRSIVNSVSALISARFEGIEERLLPPVMHRPPLAVGKRKQAVVSDVDGPVRARPGPALLKPRRPVPRAAKNALSHDAAAEIQDGGFTPVKAKKKKKKPFPTTPETSAAVNCTKVSKPAAAPAEKRRTKPKLTPAKSPAVVITLREEAASAGVTYSQVLQKASQSVNLPDLGIDGLKFRKAATGARVLELHKGQSPEKADQLAEKLRIVLDGVVRVDRPTKCAEMRITGLDDSATKEMVVAAVVKAGNCPQESVRAREVRPGPGGMGAVVVTGPVEVVRSLADASKILVGWSSARVEALQQRPLRCYKCMGVGHTRPMCPSTVNRGDLCFRCGLEGHRALVCTTAPKCAVCSAAGKPAGHHMGGRLCNPPHSKKKATARPSNIDTEDGRPQAQAEADMSD